MIVLSAALTDETREAGIAGQIVTYGLPKPLERTRKKKKLLRQLQEKFEPAAVKNGHILVIYL